MKLGIEHVSKVYGGRVWGLRDFNLALGPGILGLLGPNGAGKSTLMRILATITRASEGRVTWNGQDIAQHPNELRAALVGFFLVKNTLERDLRTGTDQIIATTPVRGPL